MLPGLNCLGEEYLRRQDYLGIPATRLHIFHVGQAVRAVYSHTSLPNALARVPAGCS